MHGRIPFVITIFCFFSFSLKAQFPTGTGVNGGFGDRGGFNSVDTVQQAVEVDTFKIFYFTLSEFYRERAFDDSLLTNYTHQLDPARQRAYDYQNLGVVGSAARPLVFQNDFRKGFDVGLHQFDLYRLPIDEMPFYRVERAFTYAEYDRGGDQPDSRIQVQFSRNFAKGVNLSLDYEKITQLSSRIQFPNQSTQASSFGIGLALQNANGRYKGYIAFANNKNIQEENGGLASEPLLSGDSNGNGNFATPASAAVQTETAFTEYRNSAYQYTHFLNLRKPEEPAEQPKPVRRMPLPPLPDSTDVHFDSLMQIRDSILATYTNPVPPPTPTPTSKSIFNKQEFLVGHSLTYEQNVYKFFETSPGSNEDFYGSFLVDTRGLRYFIQDRQLRNRLFLLTFKPEATPTHAPKQSRGLLELGIDHTFHWVQQEPESFTVNNLFLTGKWHYLPTKFLRLETYGHLGILDNIGDFRAEGKLTLSLGNLGELSGKFINQLAEPSLIYRRWLISQQPVWENVLSKVLESRLEATYAIPQRRFSVTGAYHLVTNAVYFDTLGQAQQASAALSVLQLMVKKDLTVGKFHLDNQVVLQRSSEDFVRLPELFGKHSLYYKDKWFKQVMDIRIGVDLRYTSAYKSLTYHPVIGSFHLQNQQTLPAIPLLDAHISFRITKFRAYAKIENLRNFWISHPTDADGNILDLADPANWQLYYPTANYPYANATGFRFGIKWRFLD